MARPTEFEYDVVLDRATRLFWAQGYATTSIRDLLKVMEIKESSFYNAWPSKSALYLKCLEHYIEVYMSPWIVAMMSAPNPREGLENFFDKLFEAQVDPGLPGGCLISRSLSTEVMDVPEFREYIERRWNDLTNLLTSFFQSGKDAGYYPSDLDAQSAASHLCIYIQGLQRVAMVTSDFTTLRKGVSAFLDALGL